MEDERSIKDIYIYIVYNTRLRVLKHTHTHTIQGQLNLHVDRHECCMGHVRQAAGTPSVWQGPHAHKRVNTHDQRGCVPMRCGMEGFTQPANDGRAERPPTERRRRALAAGVATHSCKALVRPWCDVGAHAPTLALSAAAVCAALLPLVPCGVISPARSRSCHALLPFGPGIHRAWGPVPVWGLH